jgi:hypothetical protein
MRATMGNILTGFKTFEALYKTQIDNYKRKAEQNVKEGTEKKVQSEQNMEEIKKLRRMRK